MKRTRQRVVITGGSGFIGSFLTERLSSSGYKNIVVLGRSEKTQNPKFEYRVCDVNKDAQSLNEMIGENDIVVHLANSTMPSTSEINRVKDVEEHISGTLSLLEICRAKKIKKFIFISSGGTVYGGDSRKKFKESDETNPKNSYGAIKISIEKYIGVFHHLHNLDYVILRLSNPYGRKFLTDKQLGAIDIFLRRAQKNEPIDIWGDGNNIRDYIHIEDVIDFLMIAVENESVSGIFNVGTGTGTSVNEVIKMIETTLKNEIRVEYHEGRSVDVTHSVLNITKAKKTGWKPKHTLSEDIKKMLSEYPLP